MKTLTLKSLTISAFRSFSEEVDVEFSLASGLKFLSGVNQVEPSLGSNGSGKSSLWDALVWCLYGTSSDGLRTSDILSRGAKNVVVAVELNINDALIRIERTGPPNKSYINGIICEQAEVDDLVGLTKPRFLQSVMFGQKSPLFADLSIPERGVIFDGILNLQLWADLAETATKKTKELDKEITTLASEKAYFEGKYDGVKDLTYLEKAAADWEATRNEEMDKVVKIAEKISDDLIALEEERRVAEVDGYANLDCSAFLEATRQGVRDKEQLTIEITKCEQAAKVCKDEINFYSDEEECPTCKQQITTDFKTRRINNLNIKIRTVNHHKEALVQNKETVDKALEENSRLSREAEGKRSVARARVDAIKKEDTRLRAVFEAALDRLDKLEKQENTHATQLQEAIKKRDEIAAKLDELTIKLQDTSGARELTAYWQQGFKRVRLFLIKRVLDHLELEVGNAASALGLVGWFISFAVEKETKSGTTKPGVQIEITSPDAVLPIRWECWSGGESQRLRLAISMGLSSLIQRMAGVVYKWEVWDEPTTWLSAEGVEDLLNCLAHRAQSLDKSVWVCDHIAHIYSGFSETWEVAKTVDGSKVRKLN